MPCHRTTSQTDLLSLALLSYRGNHSRQQLLPFLLALRALLPTSATQQYPVVLPLAPTGSGPAMLVGRLQNWRPSALPSCMSLRGVAGQQRTSRRAFSSHPRRMEVHFSSAGAEHKDRSADLQQSSMVPGHCRAWMNCRAQRTQEFPPVALDSGGLPQQAASRPHQVQLL